MHSLSKRLFALACSITSIGAVTPSPTGAPGNPYFRQVGQDIVGSSGNDLGTSVSISDDGKVVAVSGIETSFNATTSQDEYAFTVTVYQESGNSWNAVGVPIQGVNVSDFKEDAKADTSLSGDGKRLAIATVYSSVRPDIGGTPAGVVNIYSHALSDTNIEWQLLATPYEGTAGGGGGLIGLKASLDETGSKLVVGERYYDADTENNSENKGRILVYNIAADGTDSEYGDPIVGTNAGDYTGSSVMISSDGACLIYGSIGSDSTGTNSGSASVYCWVTNAWVFRQELAGEALGDEYGFSVAISADGTYVAIGGRKNDPEGRKDAGHVRVFGYNTTHYEQLGSDIDGEIGEKTSDGQYYIGDYSGYSLGLSELDAESGLIRIAIGAPNNSEYYGQVRLYECNPNPSVGSPSWTQVLYDLDGATKENAGESVAISSDGKRIVIGSPEFGGSIENYAGAVRIFEQTEYSTKPSLSPSPSQEPSTQPSVSTSPSDLPSVSLSPSSAPSHMPSISASPSAAPSDVPSLSMNPSAAPSDLPSVSLSPSSAPSDVPSISAHPSAAPSDMPSLSMSPSAAPSNVPSMSANPSTYPSTIPSNMPSVSLNPTSAESIETVFSVAVSGTCISTPEIEEALLSVMQNAVPDSIPESGPSFVIAKTISNCNSSANRQLQNDGTTDSLTYVIVADIKLEGDSLVETIGDALVGQTLASGVSANGVEVVEPSDAPSDVPSLSMNPSAAPSDLPSVSSSSSPSDVPSLSMNPSAAPSDRPSKLPSNQPSLSSSPSSSPSSQFDLVFQIKSTFSGFASTEWCLTVENKNLFSKLHVRPCKFYSNVRDNLQLFATDVYGQLKLKGPNDQYCVASTSRLVQTQGCEGLSGVVDESLQISVLRDGKLGQFKAGQQFFLGFDPEKRFSRIRLYKAGTFNTSLDKWNIVYGLAALPGLPAAR